MASDDDGDPPSPTGTGHVKNRDNLCVITSEVNWKIDEELIEGGDTAEALRDCIAEALEDVSSGVGDDKCQTAGGFTDNDTCWKALAKAEVDCGGPEVDVGGAPDEAEPEEVSKSDEPVEEAVSDGTTGGGSGVLLLKQDGVDMGHAVTVNESPDPGPAGEWKVRENVEGCEGIELTLNITEETAGGESGGSAGSGDADDSSGSDGSDPGDSSDESTDADEDPVEDGPVPGDGDGEGGEGDETRYCISTCSAPDGYEDCCTDYTTDKWCYKNFRKLRKKSDPGEAGETGPCEGGGVPDPTEG